MASGVPVIATDHSGGPDVIREGEDGFVVPIRDSDALAERIAWLHQHAEARTAMGKSARSRVEERFSRRHYGERLEQGVIAAVRSMRPDRGGSESAHRETAARPSPR